jgi:hypothetical protein
MIGPYRDQRAEALEQLVRRMPEPECAATLGDGATAYRCNYGPHGDHLAHAECDDADGSGVQAEWTDADDGATPSPWTPELLALYAEVTDGEA